MRPDFHEPTLDPLFKHLMSHKAIRNSLLTAILNEEISDSELIDGSLNPFPAFKEIRSLINDSKIEALMQAIQSIPAQALRERQNQDLLQKALSFTHKIAPYYQDLMAAIPSVERQTRLDVVCKSSYGLINVEIQIAPQDYWDLRILDHVCGLFHRQFSRGFRWKEFEENVAVSEKIMRVAGVSLFVKPPIAPENVEALLPWYKVRPWEDHELKRYFRLANQEDSRKSFRPGIEFFDFVRPSVAVMSCLTTRPSVVPDEPRGLNKERPRNVARCGTKRMRGNSQERLSLIAKNRVSARGTVGMMNVM